MGIILDIKYVSGEDWEGLYIHNKLVDETHSISFKQGFELICKYINEIKNVGEIAFDIYEIDQEWLEGVGNFPEEFDDIPSDMLEKLI